MKQKKILLILCAVLVAFVGAYYGASVYIETKEAELAAEEAIQEVLNTIYITEVDEDTIVEVTWSYYGEVLSFELDGEEWIYTEDTDVAIDSYYIETVIQSFSNITAVRELVGGDELSSYGLEEAVHYVILTDDSGVETTYYIGNEAEEDYYLAVNDKANIYTASSTDVCSIFYVLSNVIVYDTFGAPSSDELETVSIVNGETETLYTTDDTDAISMIADGLSVLTLSDCMDVNATGIESDYGLDEETRTTWTMVYNVEEESTEEVIYIGTYIETFDTYYVQVDGSNIVYSVASDTIEMMLNEYVEVVE